MQLEVGAIVEGKVTGFTAFGAFVDLEGGKKGMVHISEVALEFVKDIKDHLTVGQAVKVKVISVADDGKISLSIKKAMEQPKPAFKPKNNNAPKRSNANVWQGTSKSADNQPQSFESMMAKFKQESDEKMSDLKRDSKHGGGYNRRGTNKL
ncbi:MAG: S1 RNA-binding domain-containing protein [Clostridia bacterium]|jgi:S1 RNA binding domain protein|nr:S1 RNA-binding domain-containing protein [Clostridia bacterium]